MKNLRITVNGVAYDVQVEELGADAVAAAPAAAPAKAAPAPKAAPKTVGAGEKVAAPMPGTIVSVIWSSVSPLAPADAIIIVKNTESGDIRTFSLPAPEAHLFIIPKTNSR